MVLNDIIEQAAGRQSRTSDHGGMYQTTHITYILPLKLHIFLQKTILIPNQNHKFIPALHVTNQQKKLLNHIIYVLFWLLVESRILSFTVVLKH